MYPVSWITQLVARRLAAGGFSLRESLLHHGRRGTQESTQRRLAVQVDYRLLNRRLPAEGIIHRGLLVGYQDWLAV